MRREQVQFKVGSSEKKRIDQRVDDANLSRAEYLRQRFRVGELFWRSGEVDTELLTRIGRGDDIISVLTTDPEEITQSKSSSKDSERPLTTHEDLAEVVLNNIPHEATGDAVSDKELKEMLFGTEEDREEALNKVIRELFGESINRRHDGKLVKNTE